jgi:DHA1 family tetracycline resistance protein-like MFS transporter
MKHRAQITFLLLTVFIDTMGISIVMPVMPRLLESLTHQGANEVAFAGGVLLSIYSLAQFLSSPMLGNLSDRIGRRPVLLVALLAYAIDYVCMGYAPNLAWLLVGRLIAGVAGATAVAINAYAADITEPGERTQIFGLIGASFGAGFIAGPVLGGALGTISERAPFFGAAFLAFANVVFGYFTLPESLSPALRNAAKKVTEHPLNQGIALAIRPALVGLFAVYLCQQLAFSVFPSTWTYYLTWRFHWTPLEIGASLAFAGVQMAIVQGFLADRVSKAIGTLHTIVGSAIISSLVFIGYGFVTQSLHMVLLMACGMAMFLITPVLTGVLSERVGPEEQGTLQGILASIMSVTLIFGPLIAAQLFRFFSATTAPILIPGAAFYAAAALMVLTAVLARIFIRGSDQSSLLSSSSSFDKY